MHKMIEYICDEMDELEKKAEKGKLSMADLQSADLLAHLKKNILTADAMMDADDEYSNDGYSYARGRGRNARRDSMGRYSREGGSYRGGSYDGNYMGYDRGRNYSRAEAKEDMMMELRNLESMAQDDATRNMVKRWMKQVEEQ